MQILEGVASKLAKLWLQLYSVLYVYPQNLCTTASETTIGRGHFRMIFQLMNLELNTELKFDHL